MEEEEKALERLQTAEACDDDLAVEAELVRGRLPTSVANDAQSRLRERERVRVWWEDCGVSRIMALALAVPHPKCQ